MNASRFIQSRSDREGEVVTVIDTYLTRLAFARYPLPPLGRTEGV